jgi:hypothetical protein
VDRRDFLRVAGVGAMAPSLALGQEDKKLRRNFLLIGQSNMCDRGPAAELPYFSNLTRVFVYKRPEPLGAAEIDVRGTWEQAREEVDQAGAPGGYAGALALSFSDSLAERFPSDEIGLVPRSLPGTDIESWRKWNRKSGNYGMAVQRMWWAEEHGKTSGIIWWQGEQDAYTAKSKLWSERFGRLVSDLRVDLQNLNLPVVYVRIGSHGRLPYWGVVRQQQEWVRMKNVLMVDIDDLPANRDGIHYPTSSYVEIGKRIAEGMATML